MNSKQFFNETKQAVIKWACEHPMLALMILLAIAGVIMLLQGCDSGVALATVLVAGTDGGKHVVDGPVTTDVTHELPDDFLLNEVDKQIVKIRPMATPIDQISRSAKSKHSGSMVVDYYQVDTKPTVSTVVHYTYDQTQGRGKLECTNADIFDVSDTMLVTGQTGFDEWGSPTDQALVAYVCEKSNGVLYIVGVNGSILDDATGVILNIPEGTKLVRMGRAATELDVQTAQFEAMPHKASNFCQIFKMQVEQSTLQRLQNKEVGWTLSDQEEAAVYDMRLGMEKNFLFGVKRRIYDTLKHEWVMTTGGIWNQAGKQMSYTAGEFNEDMVVDIMREAFTGNAGSKRKILIGGSEFIGRLNKLTYSKVVSAGETVVKWGIDFTEMRSKFGKLHVLLSEVFDECGHADDAMIIDPEYLQKYSHLPFGAESLDLKASGQRNTDALVLTEASCLVLRYPKAHMRIVKEG